MSDHQMIAAIFALHVFYVAIAAMIGVLNYFRADDE